MNIENEKKIVYAASRANVWTKCLFSEVDRDVPQKFSEVPEEAERGTFLHAAVAEKLHEKFSKSFLADSPPLQKKLFLDSFFEKDVEGIEIAYVKRAVDLFISFFPVHANFKIWVEKEFRNENFYGIADAVIVDKKDKIVTVVDFKFGFHPVFADRNLQLIILSRLIFENIEEVKDFSFRGIIIQPTLEHLSFSEISVKNDLKSLLPKTHEARTGRHCKFCVKNTMCPVFQKDFQKFVSAIHSASSDTFQERLEIADAVISAAEKLKKDAREILRSGGQIPGWQLRVENGRRAWRWDFAPEIAFEKEEDREKMYDKKLISVRQAEKTFGIKKIRSLEKYIVFPKIEKIVREDEA